MEVRRLFSEGLSKSKIAVQFRVSRMTVMRILR
jgi:DNA invertase Pin-like site-specific DNA recombinase